MTRETQKIQERFCLTAFALDGANWIKNIAFAEILSFRKLRMGWKWVVKIDE